MDYVDDGVTRPCTREGCDGHWHLKHVVGEVAEGEEIGRVECDRCDFATVMARPTQRDLARGQELAREHGWL